MDPYLIDLLIEWVLTPPAQEAAIREINPYLESALATLQSAYTSLASDHVEERISQLRRASSPE